jgi:hypothetical protein
LPRVRDDRPREPRGIALAGLTTVGGEMPWGAAQAAPGEPPMWACQPIRVEVTFEPKRANAVIQEFADRKAYYAPMLPHPARWLHMSRHFFRAGMG